MYITLDNFMESRAILISNILKLIRVVKKRHALRVRFLVESARRVGLKFYVRLLSIGNNKPVIQG